MNPAIEEGARRWLGEHEEPSEVLKMLRSLCYLRGLFQGNNINIE